MADSAYPFLPLIGAAASTPDFQMERHYTRWVLIHPIGHLAISDNVFEKFAVRGMVIGGRCAGLRPLAPPIGGRIASSLRSLGMLNIRLYGPMLCKTRRPPSTGVWRQMTKRKSVLSRKTLVDLWRRDLPFKASAFFTLRWHK
jgi:hypothetical protein